MWIGVVLFEQIGAHLLIPGNDQGIHTQKLTEQVACLQLCDAKCLAQQCPIDPPLL